VGENRIAVEVNNQSRRVQGVREQRGLVEAEKGKSKAKSQKAKGKSQKAK
jgi:hypothetical protein